MSFAQDGTLVSVPIQVLYDYYNTECPQPARYEIYVCDVADDAAIVRIESQFGETRFADMFTLVKDGEIGYPTPKAKPYTPWHDMLRPLSETVEFI